MRLEIATFASLPMHIWESVELTSKASEKLSKLRRFRKIRANTFQKLTCEVKVAIKFRVFWGIVIQYQTSTFPSSMLVPYK